MSGGFTRAADLPVSTGAGLDTGIVRVSDVGSSLRAIRPQGDYLAAWDAGLFADLRYTNEPENRDGVLNHFQGFQRLRQGEWFALSGGDWHEDGGSHLFLFRMGTRATDLPWLTNLETGAEPPETDLLDRIIELDTELWHAGGMDMLGDVLAVPIEKGPKAIIGDIGGAGRDDAPHSRVLFFDLSDPGSPRRFDAVVDREGAMATCVGLTRLPNEHFLLAVSSGSPPRIDFYLSRSTTFDGGFRTRPGQVTPWFPNDASPSLRFDGYQTINLVHDADRRIHLIGLGSGGLLAGAHVAQVHTVDIPDANTPPPADRGVMTPAVLRVPDDHIEVQCPKSHCDFSGAAGVWVSGEGLILYSGSQYRLKKGVYKFTEFRPPLRGRSTPITTLRDAWVELYSEPGFRGTAFGAIDLRRGRGDRPDYSKLKIRHQKFEKRACSVRWQLPAGRRYALFRKKGFQDPVIELVGTGKVEHIADFEPLGFARKVASSRLLPP